MKRPTIKIREFDDQVYLNQTDVCNYLYFMSDLTKPFDVRYADALEAMARNLAIFNHVEGNTRYE